MQLIQSERELARLAERLAGCPRLGVDTEFIGEHTYYPVLEIIQITDGEAEALIDYQAISGGGARPQALEPLWALLAREGVECVFHHAREDVRILTRLMERPLGGVFDTQLAMSFLDPRPQIGYKNLVQDLCGARLDKGPQMFDWSRRPLPAEVLRYAIDDVRYLLPMRGELMDRLEARGRLAWYLEEQRDALREMAPADTGEAWRRVKKGGTLSRREMQVLRHLAQWREELAQRENMLVSRIMSDDVLVALARARPRRIPDLANTTRRLTRRQVDLWGPDLLAAIQRGLQDDLPEVRLTSAGAPRRDDDIQRGLTSLLGAYAEAAAHRLGLALVRLVKSAELEEIAADPAAARELGLRVLEGWRWTAVGEDLLALAEGRLAVYWDARTGSLRATQRAT